MAIVIPDEVVAATHMTSEELMQEIAIMPFQREKLTLAKASKLAGMGRMQFQFLLASRQIPMHYSVPEFRADMQTLRGLDQS
jgi:predicted HTH domain antitoxin